MAIGNFAQKLMYTGRVVPEIGSRTDIQTHRHKRHAHRNTPLPYRARRNKKYKVLSTA